MVYQRPMYHSLESQAQKTISPAMLLSMVVGAAVGMAIGLVATQATSSSAAYAVPSVAINTRTQQTMMGSMPVRVPRAPRGASSYGVDYAAMQATAEPQVGVTGFATVVETPSYPMGWLLAAGASLAAAAFVWMRQGAAQEKQPFAGSADYCIAMASTTGMPGVPTTARSEEDGPEPRDDDVLPESLIDAVSSASRATADAILNGERRCLSEVLVEGFWDPVSGPVFADDGDTERWWSLNRTYIDTLIQAGGFENVQVVFPDIGVAALLTQQWPNPGFEIANLGSRIHKVPEGCDLVVFAAPDPQGAEEVQKIVNNMPETAAVAIFNPRLASGDVGIGTTIRRLRDGFLNTFLTTYSIRPIAGVGAVFKCYPSRWKVFVNDDARPGRYTLAKECDTRPAGDELDDILYAAMAPKNADGSAQELSPFEQVAKTISGLTRFMGKL